MKYRVNRPLIKQQAKLAFYQNWRPLVLAGVILVALGILLDLMRARFLPELTLTIPAEALVDPDAMNVWLASYTNSLLAAMDGNFWLTFALISLLTILVTVPLKCGLYQLCWRAVHGEQDIKVTDMFAWISSLRRVAGSIGMAITIVVLTALWTILFDLPAFAVALIVLLVPTLGPGTLMLLVALIYPLAFAGSLFSLTRTLGYQAAHFTYSGEPDKGIRGALREVRTLLKGRRWEFFVLYLSFLLWFIVSSLTYGVADLFVAPYLCMTVLLFLDAVRQGPPPAPPVNPWSPDGQSGGPDGRA